MRYRDRLSRQYEFEVAQANRLKSSPLLLRKGLYSQIYREYFLRFDSEGSQQKNGDEAYETNLKIQALTPLVNSKHGFHFLEIGGGSHDFISKFSTIVEECTAIDAYLKHDRSLEDRVDFVCCDSPPYPLESCSIDLAFSNHFIEHLHPEDQLRHLVEIYRLLKSGGQYVCVTPNIIYGPHDVSKHFGCRVALGLHLKELGYAELSRIFYKSGFRNLRSISKIGRLPDKISFYGRLLGEQVLRRIPDRYRDVLWKYLGDVQRPFRPFEQVLIVGAKGS